VGSFSDKADDSMTTVLIVAGAIIGGTILGAAFMLAFVISIKPRLPW